MPSVGLLDRYFSIGRHRDRSRRHEAGNYQFEEAVGSARQIGRLLIPERRRLTAESAKMTGYGEAQINSDNEEGAVQRKKLPGVPALVAENRHLGILPMPD
jgi:hypothetical protein